MRTTPWTCIVGLSVAFSVPSVEADEAYFAREGQFTLLNGDINGDLKRDLSDAVSLLGHLYLGTPEPAELACDSASVQNGDSNGDGVLDVSDGVHLVNWLYGGGAEPVPGCGVDGGAGAAGATVTTTSMHIAVTPPPAISVCDADIITLTGDAQSLRHDTVTPNGDIRSIFVIAWSALRGVGLSGTEYIGTGQSIVITTIGPGQTTTLEATMRFITPDGGGDHHAVAFLHVTRNANGDITANVSDVSFECRGEGG